MEWIETDTITSHWKHEFLQLWNREYPINLTYSGIEELDHYLNNLSNKKYFLLVENDHLLAISMQFARENETWFLIIVDREQQQKGLGSQMLNKLKLVNESLSGWVIDRPGYQTGSGKDYQSPIEFYLKNEFRLLPDIRLETSAISAVRIVWRKE